MARFNFYMRKDLKHTFEALFFNFDMNFGFLFGSLQSYSVKPFSAAGTSEDNAH